MQKSISDAQVKRMRNIVQKKYTSKTEVQAGYTRKTSKHLEGDIWEENGKQWTIKNGIKQTISKLKSARKKYNKPLCCPKCKGSISHRLNDIMWPIHGMCFKCVAKLETKLRIDGKYDEYQQAIMKGNYDAWLSDVEQEYAEWLNTTQGNKYITEAGHSEDWTGYNKESVAEKIETGINNVKRNFTRTINGEEDDN